MRLVLDELCFVIDLGMKFVRSVKMWAKEEKEWGMTAMSKNLRVTLVENRVTVTGTPEDWEYGMRRMGVAGAGVGDR